MNKETWLSILRSVLTAVGAYLIGKNFLGETIDNVLWEGILGSAMTLVSVVWGWLDKTATVEAIQSGLRSVIIFVGTLLVGSGVIKDEVLQGVLGIVALLVPVIYSQLSKKKSRDIAKGEVKIADLSGVDSQTPITPNTIPVKSKT